METSSLGKLEQQAMQVEYYIQQCLFDSGLKGIYIIGWQGGRFTKLYPDIDERNLEYESHGYVRIPYWYKNKIDVSPSKEEIEVLFSEFMLDDMQSCLDFDKFVSLEGAELIKPNKSQTYITVKINDNDVDIVYYYPLELRYKNEKKMISDLDANLPISYGEMIDLAKDLQKKATAAASYDLSGDCESYYEQGPYSIFFYNNRYVINNYATFFDKRIARTYTLQFLMEDVSVYGYCPGE